jgi:hypothetical protein
MMTATFVAVYETLKEVSLPDYCVLTEEHYAIVLQ